MPYQPAPPPSPAAAPPHFAPPTARELRGQAVRRLQAGLFGLAAIMLIVGPATIINDRARKAELASDPAASAIASTKAAEKTDPLADAGVVPATTPETPPSSPAPAGAAPPR